MNIPRLVKLFPYRLGLGFLTAGWLLLGVGLHAGELPARYFRLLEAELALVEKRLDGTPNADLQTLEAGPGGRHFPGTILAAAVLYANEHGDNRSAGDATKL